MKKKIITFVMAFIIAMVPVTASYAAHIHNYKNHEYSGGSYVTGITTHQHLDSYVNGKAVYYACDIWNYGVQCYLKCDCGAKLDSSVHEHSVGASHHVHKE